MNGLEELLGARAGFALAAFAVSWIAVALLALVAANLHFRLAHLERSLPAKESPTPYGHLLGRGLADVLGPEASPATRLALVLASDCPSCERLLGELRRAAGRAPVALLWRDATPSPRPPLPAGVTVLGEGPRISRALGVGVSPFALAADTEGRIVRAAPVGGVDALEGLLDHDDHDDHDSAGEPPERAAAPLPNPTLKGVS